MLEISRRPAELSAGVDLSVTSYSEFSVLFQTPRHSFDTITVQEHEKGDTKIRESESVRCPGACGKTYYLVTEKEIYG